MDIFTYIEILSAGVGAGIFAGLFGVGGGIVMIPFLVLLLKWDVHLASGTSLAALLLPTNFTALWRYYKNELLPKLKNIAMISVGLMIGNAFGSAIAVGMISNMLASLFGIYLIIVGVRDTKLLNIIVFSEKNTNNGIEKYSDINDINIWYFLLLGIASGILAGLFGIGGGLLITIVATNIMKLNMRQAVALSLASMFLPSGILGVLQYNAHEYVNWIAAILLAVGIEVGSAFSSKLTLKLNMKLYKKIFGGILILLGIYYILRNYIF